MTTKNLLIKFQQWMHQTTMDDPLKFETDLDDVAMMFLAENPECEDQLLTDNETKELNKNK